MILAHKNYIKQQIRWC